MAKTKHLTRSERNVNKAVYQKSLKKALAIREQAIKQNTQREKENIAEQDFQRSMIPLNRLQAVMDIQNKGMAGLQKVIRAKELQQAQRSYVAQMNKNRVFGQQSSGSNVPKNMSMQARQVRAYLQSKPKLQASSYQKGQIWSQN